MVEKKTQVIVDGILDLEEKYDLFSLKEQDVYIWKLVRVDIFQKIFMNVQGIEQIHLKDSSLNKWMDLLSIINNTVFRNPIFKGANKKDFIIEYPRKVNYNGEMIDPYTHFYLQNKQKGDYELLEQRYVGRLVRSVWSTNSTMDYQMLFSKLLKFVTNVQMSDSNQKVLQEVANEIQDKFNVKINVIELAHTKLKNFIAIYKVFNYTFRKTKPNNLLLVVSYVSEAIIAAARNNQVNVIEFQHGVIGPLHLGYHFPNNEKVPYFPDEIYLFGEFWGNATALPKSVKKVYYGYPYLKEYISNHLNEIDQKVEKEVVVISQGTIGKELSEVVFDLATRLPDYTFNYKLHPGEFGRWKKDYPKLVELEKLPNVQVFEGEKNLYDLFASSSFVIGVYSTAIYEAIAFKARPIILKLPGYEYMTELETQFNVPILDTFEAVKNYIVDYQNYHVDLDINAIFADLYK